MKLMEGYDNALILRFKSFENAKRAQCCANRDNFITELSQSEEYPYEYIVEMVKRPKGYKKPT